MTHYNRLANLVYTFLDWAMSMLALLLLLLATATVSASDFVFENEVIKLDEIFDLDYARESDVSIYNDVNTTSYYCVFRSHWTAENHPAQYPELARWGDPIMFSHTKQYAPFLKNLAAPNGVEQIAEECIPDVFLQEIDGAGQLVGNLVEGKGFFVDQKKSDENFVYLPPLRVNADHSYISGIAPVSPSPDWYTGFYLFNTFKEDTLTYWDSFKIRTYPWDAGTDDGDSYTAQPRDTDPPGLITRIEKDNTVNGIFLNAAGDTIPYLAEWECVLNTCPLENPECEKPDWPPTNNCDILKYPQCNTPCNPDVDKDCEQCKRESDTEEKVYHPNCCLAGREPKDGTCEAETKGNTTTSGAAAVSWVVTTATFIWIHIALLR